MRRFFKNPLFNSLARRIWRRCKQVWIQTILWVMKYKLHTRELLVCYYQSVENLKKQSWSFVRKFSIVVKCEVNVKKWRRRGSCFCCFLYLEFFGGYINGILLADSKKLVTCLFWSHMKTNHFVICLWLIDIDLLQV